MLTSCPASSAVADKVAGGIVVAAVNLFQARPVEVHGDRRVFTGVADTVDAAVAGEYRGGSVLRAPEELPGFPKAGVLCHGAVVCAVVALFEHRSYGAGVGAPGGVVVDLGCRPRRPHEDLQGVGAVVGVIAAGDVPAIGVARLPEE